MLFLLLGLVGTRVTVTARSGGRYEGILSATAVGGDLSVVLKFVATSTEPEAPLKPSLTISGRDIVTIGAIDVDLDARTSALPPINPLNAVSGPADSFRTDTDISGVGGAANEGRTLQQWTGSAAPLPSDNALEDGKGATWDQFAVNERLYGVKTVYDDDLYTTKLDRSGKDYADRERRAAKVASEILSSAPTNAHVAEERNLATGRAEGLSEEDRCVMASARAHYAGTARSFEVQTPTCRQELDWRSQQSNRALRRLWVGRALCRRSSPRPTTGLRRSVRRSTAVRAHLHRLCRRGRAL